SGAAHAHVVRAGVPKVGPIVSTAAGSGYTLGVAIAVALAMVTRARLGAKATVGLRRWPRRALSLLHLPHVFVTGDSIGTAALECQHHRTASKCESQC